MTASDVPNNIAPRSSSLICTQDTHVTTPTNNAKASLDLTSSDFAYRFSKRNSSLKLHEKHNRPSPWLTPNLPPKDHQDGTLEPENLPILELIIQESTNLTEAAFGSNRQEDNLLGIKASIGGASAGNGELTMEQYRLAVNMVRSTSFQKVTREKFS